MQAVRQQLDALQNRAAAVVAGVEPPRLLQPHGMEEGGPLNASIAETGFLQRLQLPVSLLVQMVDIPFYEHPLIRNPCFALPALEAAVQDVWRERGALVSLLRPPRVLRLSLLPVAENLLHGAVGRNVPGRTIAPLLAFESCRYMPGTDACTHTYF